MATRTFGLNLVDREARVDVERLRAERLARLSAERADGERWCGIEGSGA